MSHIPITPSNLHTPPLPHQDVPFSRPTTPSHGGPHKIGFLGLGAMGHFMARNLATNRHSHPAGSPPILVWNRSVSKSEQLVREVGEGKALIAQSPGEIATECDIIFTNLGSDEAVKTIYLEFAKAFEHTPPTGNKIFVETSTIYPALAGELDSIITAFPHCHLVTCPVFGAPAAADKAQLIAVMSGDYRSKKEVAHILIPAVGRKVYDLGGNLEKAATFKLVGNSMILGCLEIMGEAFTLAEKGGIEAETVNALIKDVLPAPALIAYGDKMVHDAFDGSKGFAIDGGIKDATHIRTLSTKLSTPMPAIDVAHQHLLTARSIHQAQSAAGRAKYGTLDWSAVVSGSRVAAGLDPFDSAKHQRVVKEED